MMGIDGFKTPCCGAKLVSKTKTKHIKDPDGLEFTQRSMSWVCSSCEKDSGPTYDIQLSGTRPIDDRTVEQKIEALNRTNSGLADVIEDLSQRLGECAKALCQFKGYGGVECGGGGPVPDIISPEGLGRVWVCGEHLGSALRRGCFDPKYPPRDSGDSRAGVE